MKLKPCPFCGSEPYRACDIVETDTNGVEIYALYCRGCGVHGPADRSYDKAIEAWNTRQEKEDE